MTGDLFAQDELAPISRWFYDQSIEGFLADTADTVLGRLAASNLFSLELTQRNAWQSQIEILKTSLSGLEGSVFFEFVIPRMGKRADVIIVVQGCIFVIEFKVGASEYLSSDLDQVEDYTLDLRNFHSESHDKTLIPLLVATRAPGLTLKITSDILSEPKKCNSATLRPTIEACLAAQLGATVDVVSWSRGRYSPTPSIVEAARALFQGHNVAEISRTDAGATNLFITSQTVSQIIEKSREHNEKAICFVTGVPGAGKTLVGLDITSRHNRVAEALHTVFLSGNGPLVAVLHEALARDKVAQEKAKGNKQTKKDAEREVKAFVQNVHHYRDEYIRDKRPPVDHVAIFDESQRAWNKEQTVSFMAQKKAIHDFDQSEPSFLISCLDRHPDWAVVICLVGGGQEINKGEAGISLWLESIEESHPDWKVYISPKLSDSEFGVDLQRHLKRLTVSSADELHLGISMRSFRSERVSELVRCILDLEVEQAKALVESSTERYPIVLTRNIDTAKQWLRSQARGSERTGIVVSSAAERLRPLAINVTAKMNPVHWFLAGKEDVRSSYFLEDVATEFDVQGLEIDWACVTWDADFRLNEGAWQHWSFVGDRWNRVNKAERRRYQKNAYRVLLTRARQGMVICVPEGSTEDHTRQRAFYDGTFEYLKSLGLPQI